MGQDDGLEGIQDLDRPSVFADSGKKPVEKAVVAVADDEAQHHQDRRQREGGVAHGQDRPASAEPVS